MRFITPITAVTLAAVVSAGTIMSRPAHAAASDAAVQPLMVAQNNQGPNLFSMLQELQRQQEQIRNLTGQIDTLKYKLRQNKQGQQDLYKNLDKRLSALENGGGSAAGGGATEGNNGDYGGGDQSPGGQADPAVQSAYSASFDKLKSGDYDGAISGFNAFLKQHPETNLSDNAWYWLGEANYVKGDFDASLKAFQSVVNRFSDSKKVPDSLYKIGLIQSDRGQNDNARATLKRITDQYPNTKAADLANKHLQSMGG